ncbi:hypothetical protein [Labrys sp. (in: a-proteobacteria)]|uniref:hypothetical protein n=1 Tax=Labrys sp. (in: a-proteobacteria) TaxID=1917972 RepID=UPI0039E5AA36
MADSAFTAPELMKAWLRDFRTPGVPSSGVNEPDKAEGRAVADALGTELSALKAGQISGKLTYATRAELYADLSPAENVGAEVWNDPDPNLNGVYRKVGAPGTGNWQYLSPLGNYQMRSEIDALEVSVGQVSAKLATMPLWYTVDGGRYGGEDLVFASVYNNGVMQFGVTVSGRFVVPGELEMAGESDLAYAVTFADGLLGLGVPRDGSRLKLRGWLMSAASAATITHHLLLGQSNGIGADAIPVVTSSERYHSLMFSGGEMTFAWNGPYATNPAGRPASQFELVPLQQQIEQANTGERVSSGIAAQLKSANAGGRYSTSNLKDTAPCHLFSGPTIGSRYLSEIDWRDVNNEGQWVTFIDDLKRAKQSAANLGYDYAVGALHLTNGENEAGNGKISPNGAVLTYAAMRATFAADIVTARQKWQQAIRDNTGQPDQVVPMFIEQVNGGLAMPMGAAVAGAQVDATVTDEDIIMVGPHYYVPSAMNSTYANGTHGATVHMSADGVRWRGEQRGKVMRRVMQEGRRWTPLKIRSVTRVDDTHIRMKFWVPYTPLAFEDYHLPTAPSQGFHVFAGTPTAVGSEKTVTAVALTAADEVTLTLDAATPVAAGSQALVQYGLSQWADKGLCTVTAVRDGPANGYGVATVEVKLSADMSALTARYLREGCFKFIQYSANASTLVVRAAYLEGGVTVLRGEKTATDYTNTMVADASLTQFLRDRPWGNLRDSDPALSVYTFTDPSYGTRQGQYYPLNNYCCQFSEAIIT